MRSLLVLLSTILRAMVRTRADLVAKNAALRQQFDAYRRRAPRPRLRPADRAVWVWLARHWSRWRSALVVVKPDTVLRWHRAGYRWLWRRRCRANSGRPRIPRPHIEIIRRISKDHPEWGEDRIALELKLKLGVDHSPRTVSRYLVKTAGSPSSSWRRFLAAHAGEILAVDLTTHYLWSYSLCYVLVVLALDTRQVVHVAVTASPTLDWVKQQIRQALATSGPRRFLLHDNDGIYGQFGRRRAADANGGTTYRCNLDLWLAQALAMTGLPTPYGAPNASAHVERVIGTIRRECFEHHVFLSLDHLRRVVEEYLAYYNDARPHQGIRSIPDWEADDVAPPPQRPLRPGDRVLARPVLGGLHHDYRIAA